MDNPLVVLASAEPHLGNQHRIAVEPAGPEVGQGFICCGEWVNRGVGAHNGRASYRKERFCIPPRQVGDRDQVPLLPTRWRRAWMECRSCGCHRKRQRHLHTGRNAVGTRSLPRQHQGSAPNAVAGAGERISCLNMLSFMRFTSFFRRKPFPLKLLCSRPGRQKAFIRVKNEDHPSGANGWATPRRARACST